MKKASVQSLYKSSLYNSVSKIFQFQKTQKKELSNKYNKIGKDVRMPGCVCSEDVLDFAILSVSVIVHSFEDYPMIYSTLSTRSMLISIFLWRIYSGLWCGAVQEKEGRDNKLMRLSDVKLLPLQNWVILQPILFFALAECCEP
jgi:hypothetical protein